MEKMEKDFVNWLENDPEAKKLIDNIVTKALDKNYFIPMYGKTEAEIRKKMLTGDGVSAPRGEFAKVEAKPLVVS